VFAGPDTATALCRLRWRRACSALMKKVCYCFYFGIALKLQAAMERIGSERSLQTEWNFLNS
jgi:hypothetical protein